MDKIKCIIIDDSVEHIQLLQSYIARTSYVEFVDSFKNVNDASDFIVKNHVDLIIKSVDAPKEADLEAIENNKIYCIMICNTTTFAFTAYQYDIVDYLIKPVSYERFMKACSKVLRLVNNFIIQADSSFFIENMESEMVNVKVSDIFYFEKENKNKVETLKIHTSTGILQTKNTLDKLTGRLKSSNFVRIHKNYLVSFMKIELVDKSHVVVNKTQIPVDDSYREDLMYRINVV